MQIFHSYGQVVSKKCVRNYLKCTLIYTVHTHFSSVWRVVLVIVTAVIATLSVISTPAYTHRKSDTYAYVRWCPEVSILRLFDTTLQKYHLRKSCDMYHVNCKVFRVVLCYFLLNLHPSVVNYCGKILVHYYVLDIFWKLSAERLNIFRSLVEVC